MPSSPRAGRVKTGGEDVARGAKGAWSFRWSAAPSRQPGGRCKRRKLLAPNFLTGVRTSSSKYHSPDPFAPETHLLTLLPTDPPAPALCLGRTTTIPPSAAPDSFTSNPKFLTILSSVLAEHASQDEGVISQAQAMASTSGSALGSGGMFFPSQGKRNRRREGMGGGGGGASGSGAGPTSSQGGAGGGGRGGHIHVWDSRHPPDFGRIPEPEDIFGSLEVDARGCFTDATGRWQESGTYRIVTREGVLGLSDFLRGRLVERLKIEEANLLNS